MRSTRQECANCHVKFDRAAQDGLCLDCHKEVGADVRAKQGYHGRLESRTPAAAATPTTRGVT